MTIQMITEYLQETKDNRLLFSYENISELYFGRGTFISIIFPFLLLNTISVFILIISVSSISSVNCLEYHTIKFAIYKKLNFI